MRVLDCLLLGCHKIVVDTFAWVAKELVLLRKKDRNIRLHRRGGTVPGLRCIRGPIKRNNHFIDIEICSACSMLGQAISMHTHSTPNCYGNRWLAHGGIYYTDWAASWN